MKYPAIYATTFCFWQDGATIVAVIGSMAGVLCDVSLVFFVVLLHLKCPTMFYMHPMYNFQKCCGQNIYFLFSLFINWDSSKCFGAHLIVAQLLYWNSSQIISFTILYPLSASFFIFGKSTHWEFTISSCIVTVYSCTVNATNFCRPLRSFWSKVWHVIYQIEALSKLYLMET